MADEHRRAAEVVGHRTEILQVVGKGNRGQRLRCRAGAVSAQAKCDCAIAGICEEVQEVVVPARAMPAAVHEKQRDRMRIGAGSFVNHLEHEADPLLRPPAPSRPPRGFVETQATATLNGSCAWCKCRGATVPGSDSAAGSALPLGWQGV